MIEESLILEKSLGLVEIILEEVGLSEERIATVKREVKKAVENNGFEFVIKKGKCIGFFTWFDKSGDIFINNMFILKEYRTNSNFLYLRDYFKKMNKNDYYWRDRKKGGWIRFNRRMYAPTIS